MNKILSAYSLKKIKSILQRLFSLIVIHENQCFIIKKKTTKFPQFGVWLYNSRQIYHLFDKEELGDWNYFRTQYHLAA